jgi:oligoribonuclease NrnB/cAMP/cGMP phosphodiesterase (DHH superfamily)
MEETQGLLERTFELNAIPSIGTKLIDSKLEKAKCRDESDPIVISDVSLNADENQYIIKTCQISIAANYLNRISDWKNTQG